MNEKQDGYDIAFDILGLVSAVGLLIFVAYNAVLPKQVEVTIKKEPK